MEYDWKHFWMEKAKILMLSFDYQGGWKLIFPGYVSAFYSVIPRQF